MIFTSEHYDRKHVPHHKISDADALAFSKQYPKLTIRYNELFHDRFLIIDDRELYLIGASLKDIGGKCFGFTKMDSREIRRIKKLFLLCVSTWNFCRMGLVKRFPLKRGRELSICVAL